MTQSARPFYLLLIVFVGSGFAGLIYESVWAQYLKLFLGHAAYAQTMVLCIFMGGLALGAWLAARYSEKIRHPLLAYAVIEVGIGLLGLIFHAGFTRAVDFHYQSLLPLTTDPFVATAIKGLLAVVLIGPQTVLLGTTFPLMTAGVLRALGAFIGVAASVVPYLTQEESRRVLSPLLQGPCVVRMGEMASTVSELIKSVIERDGAGMRSKGEELLEKLPRGVDRRLMRFALDSAMVGSIVAGAPAHAHTLWQKYGEQVKKENVIPIDSRLMLSVAEVRMRRP